MIKNHFGNVRKWRIKIVFNFTNTSNTRLNYVLFPVVLRLFPLTAHFMQLTNATLTVYREFYFTQPAFENSLKFLPEMQFLVKKLIFYFLFKIKAWHYCLQISLNFASILLRTSVRGILILVTRMFLNQISNYIFCFFSKWDF